MKTVDKKEVYSSQSPEFIEQAEEGKFHKLIPDTFIIKMEGGKQGYAIRHLNRKDILLIDTVGQGAQQAIKNLVSDGYTIKGLIITHRGAMENAYGSLKEISEDMGKAPIFIHSMNLSDSSFAATDITRKSNILDHFSIRIHDFPAKSGESSLVYSEINDGMVFSGCCAVGAPYGSDQTGFERADMGNENKDFSLAESWRTFIEEFTYFFPFKGKPGFNLSEGEQKDIITKLGRTGYPGGGNPNL